MALVTIDLTPRIGTELVADKSTLLSGGAAIAAEIRRLLDRRGILIARGVGFDDADQVAFAKSLGTVRLGTVKSEGAEGILKVTFDKTENPAYADYFHGNFYWHIDGTYDEVPPLGTVLTPRILSPTGGETEFASTYASYEDLPESEKSRLDNLQVVHTLDASQRPAFPSPSNEQREYWSTFPKRLHPLVWRHRSGRKSLALSTSCDHVVGMVRTESDALLQHLMSWATRPEYVYQHRWKMGDMVLWDNTGSMHRVRPFDIKCGRRLHRVTLEGEEPLSTAA
jgi:alpha-ketoglutarate-dependent taurine dioxygenase